MKILKIKKGFITNSSGSYEWIPPQENNPPGDNSKPAQPVAISKSYSAQSNSDAGAKGGGLDPSIMLFGAFFIMVAIIAIVAEIAGKIRRKIKSVKKN